MNVDAFDWRKLIFPNDGNDFIESPLCSLDKTNIPPLNKKIDLSSIKPKCIIPSSLFEFSEQHEPAHKLSLVLDLDNTLLHALMKRIASNSLDTFDPLSELFTDECGLPELIMLSIIPEMTGTIVMKLRPGLRHFLMTLADMFDLYVFTHGQLEYAEAVLAGIDPLKNLVGHNFKARGRLPPGRVPSTIKVINQVTRRPPTRTVVVDDRSDVLSPEFLPCLLNADFYRFLEAANDEAIDAKNLAVKMREVGAASDKVPDPYSSYKEDFDRWLYSATRMLKDLHRRVLHCATEPYRPNEPAIGVPTVLQEIRAEILEGMLIAVPDRLANLTVPQVTSLFKSTVPIAHSEKSRQIIAKNYHSKEKNNKVNYSFLNNNDLNTTIVKEEEPAVNQNFDDNQEKQNDFYLVEKFVANSLEAELRRRPFAAVPSLMQSPLPVVATSGEDSDDDLCWRAPLSRQRRLAAVHHAVTASPEGPGSPVSPADDLSSFVVFSNQTEESEDSEKNKENVEKLVKREEEEEEEEESPTEPQSEIGENMVDSCEEGREPNGGMMMMLNAEANEDTDTLSSSWNAIQAIQEALSRSGNQFTANVSGGNLIEFNHIVSLAKAGYLDSLNLPFVDSLEHRKGLDAALNALALGATLVPVKNIPFSSSGSYPFEPKCLRTAAASSFIVPISRRPSGQPENLPPPDNKLLVDGKFDDVGEKPSAGLIFPIDSRSLMISNSIGHQQNSYLMSPVMLRRLDELLVQNFITGVYNAVKKSAPSRILDPKEIYSKYAPILHLLSSKKYHFCKWSTLASASKFDQLFISPSRSQSNCLIKNHNYLIKQHSLHADVMIPNFGYEEVAFATAALRWRPGQLPPANRKFSALCPTEEMVATSGDLEPVLITCRQVKNKKSKQIATSALSNVIAMSPEAMSEYLAAKVKETAKNSTSSKTASSTTAQGVSPKNQTPMDHAKTQQQQHHGAHHYSGHQQQQSHHAHHAAGQYQGYHGVSSGGGGGYGQTGYGHHAASHAAAHHATGHHGAPHQQHQPPAHHYQQQQQSSYPNNYQQQQQQHQHYGRHQ